ncbi:hypothetical protein [Leucobacter luti]|uniref:Sap-like sulfolipid-1-addressing protein n=1 Tax=Leucobacter luti TaxID=340320 RepID=A0A4Q7TVC8_9MICO|nr:hypothetical protein [Leucobacter luti]MBL3698214.1 hypothetical protein [Leucobacter luti]RZT64703.1 hypothetical protein EV139_2126 [Leucobacter luti]
MHETLSWAAAVLSLIGFALVFGVHPMLYGATADMLARGGEFRPSLGALLAGLVCGATAMYALLHVVNPTRYLAAAEHDLERAATNHTIDLWTGIAFIVAAIVVVTWRLIHPGFAPAPVKLPQQGTAVLAYFVVGIGCAVVGFTTWPLMYLVMRVVTGLSASFMLRGTAFAVFLAALVIPFVLLAWLWSRFPVAAKKITTVYARVLAADYRWGLAIVLALGGVLLIGFAALPR